MRLRGRRLRRLPRAAWICASLGWMAGIAWLSSRPAPLVGRRSAAGRFAINFAHAPLYAGLGFLLAFATARRGGAAEPAPDPVRAGSAAALSLAYGLFDEWIQSHVSTRVASVVDWCTDATGAISGVCLAAALLGARPPLPLLAAALAAAISAGCAALATLPFGAS